ncbi:MULTISPECIES: DUF1345 domain-containing protein [unclassified Sphingomonas]|uniref:DUF1345 domain-containing protein n=1 Tax=unclassified Sphingomonas TaxID=196159 RepID=UPI000E763E47|nr:MULTISPECIES: DUF1345 domain-containing protein [unclassified Sphingomonas]RKE43760.1 putative membrane protein [Sphingomonas sp. PP-CC-1A-547]TCM05987.1 putative membrane protein [Sphingomonas sp. PP-CC-3G-468]
MNDKPRYWGLGQRVAPPRFILFVLVFAIGLATLIPRFGLGRGTMAAFDVAAVVFLIAVSTLFRNATAARMRRAAEENDANRAVLLGFSGTIMLVILVAVAKELQGKNDAIGIALTITTLALAWLFSNMIYTLHYAHLFYVDDPDGKDAKGLDFPSCDEPDYWDFAYFAFTLGMTFQTSDVQITSRRVRKAALGQCMAAFVFNIGVLAFTINVLGSAG